MAQVVICALNFDTNFLRAKTFINAFLHLLFIIGRLDLTVNARSDSTGTPQEAFQGIRAVGPQSTSHSCCRRALYDATNANIILSIFSLSIRSAAPKSRCLPKCPDANKRYFLRDRPFFVPIAVIVVQAGATSAGPIFGSQRLVFDDNGANPDPQGK